jgi:hypothetical protein
MLRTFNYTKRKKINKDNISISLNKISQNTFFNISLDLKDFDFPPDSKVYVEAYYGPTSFRYDFGSIENLLIPDDNDITPVLHISEKVYFRIKVVEPQSGLVIGFADKICLADDEKKLKSSIFFVNRIHMDTNEIWRMNFDADSEGTPILEINNSIEGINDIARSDINFLNLVYPAALRMILDKLSSSGNFDREGDEWTCKWIIFIEDVLGINNTPENNQDEDKINEWINDVVRSFCRRNKLLEQYIKLLVNVN